MREFENMELKLIWGACYSYNNTLAEQFNSNPNLAFLFLAPSKLILE